MSNSDFAFYSSLVRSFLAQRRTRVCDQQPAPCVTDLSLAEDIFSDSSVFSATEIYANSLPNIGNLAYLTLNFLEKVEEIQNNESFQLITISCKTILDSGHSFEKESCYKLLNFSEWALSGSSFPVKIIAYYLANVFKRFEDQLDFSDKVDFDTLSDGGAAAYLIHSVVMAVCLMRMGGVSKEEVIEHLVNSLKECTPKIPKEITIYGPGTNWFTFKKV